MIRPFIIVVVVVGVILGVVMAGRDNIHWHGERDVHILPVNDACAALAKNQIGFKHHVHLSVDGFRQFAKMIDDCNAQATPTSIPVP